MPALLSRLFFRLREFVFVQVHVNFPAAEGDSFSFQAEALFESVISAEFYFASGA
jgi:hypothetical protein